MCSDDLYLPWAISTAVKYLQRYPEVELVYGDMITVGMETGLNRLSFFPKVSLPFLKRSGYLPSTAALFRASVVDKVGLVDENLSDGGDYEYWIRVAEKCQILKIEEFLSVDRPHAQNRRTLMRKQIRAESRMVRERFGMPKGVMRYPVRIVDTIRAYFDTRVLRIKFAACYWASRKKYPSHANNPRSWQKLMEFPGFRFTSVFGFLLLMLPWVSKRYKRNWFEINI